MLKKGTCKYAQKQKEKISNMHKKKKA